MSPRLISCMRTFAAPACLAFLSTPTAGLDPRQRAFRLLLSGERSCPVVPVGLLSHAVYATWAGGPPGGYPCSRAASALPVSPRITGCYAPACPRPPVLLSTVCLPALPAPRGLASGMIRARRPHWIATFVLIWLPILYIPSEEAITWVPP
eukprot:gene680-biopygen2190